METPTGRRPSRLHLERLAAVDQAAIAGRERIGHLTDRDLLVAGVALYAGEGMKTGNRVGMANTDPAIIAFFLTWLRRFFEPPEEALRVRLCLHEGLDLDRAAAFWSSLTGIPASQFHRPYRAVADDTRRRAKHELGCPAVVWYSASAQRTILGLQQALLSSTCFPG